jgi:hypothetical protein
VLRLQSLSSGNAKNIKEDIEKKPFRDVLNRLEKLEIIENADVWIELRKGRNTKFFL